MLEAVIVRGMNQCAARLLLNPALRRKSRRELIPEVVVLAHGVDQPAHVHGMPHGICREPHRDDLIDGLATPGLTDISQPVREIRGPLPAESVRRRGDDAGAMTGLAER